MRSAPAPDLLPIPGMNQGTAVAAGDGGSGGDDGSGGDGNDKEGAGGGDGGDDANGDNRNAPDPVKYPTCGTESHPVDVVTGRVFTHSIADLELPGPLPFTFERAYSSTASKQDQGLGFGWAHSLGWFVEVFRTRVRVWNEKGVSVSFPIPQIGHSILGDWGWVIRRELWGFAVDANDDVWRIFSTSFDEGATFRLTAIEDRNKNRIALTYDDGKLVEIKDSAGRIIKVTSTKQGRIASIEVKNSEHLGQWIAFARYQYDDKGRLLRVTDADDYSWTYEYDDYNRLVRDTDRVGLSFCFRYDEKDRGIEAWGEYASKKDLSLADDLPAFLADGTTRAKGIYHRKFDYHPRGYTEVTDTRATRRYFGNSKGLLDKAVDGGAVTTSRYDSRGFEIEKTNPVGAVRTWLRDERGRVLDFVDSLGRRSSVRYDANGLAIELVDAAGGVLRMIRDQRGNVETFIDASGSTKQFSYDSRGLITSATWPNGALVHYLRDAQGNLIEMRQPNGGVWHWTYDAFGRCSSEIDPTGATTRFAYSAYGTILALYDGSGGVTRYSHDGEGHLTQFVTPAGATTQYVWGGFHKLCARRDANGGVVGLRFDREGSLTVIVNEREQPYRLAYDEAGRLTREETFDGRTLRYRYDVAGKLVRSENGAGEITSLVYDLEGQLVERKHADESGETFTYNARGELAGGTSGSAEVVLERDSVGQLVRETTRIDGTENWVATKYDAVGRVVRKTTSLGHVRTVERDAMGSPTRVDLDGSKVEHIYDLLCHEVARKLPGGGLIESRFDPMGRLAERSLRGPTEATVVGDQEPEWIGRRDDGIVAITRYQYDGEGRLVSKLDRSRGVTRFEHDPIGQLVAVLPEGALAALYRYDPAGNPFETSPAESASRVYAAGGRLLRKGDTDYRWDEEGRLTEKREHVRNLERAWRYAWNGSGLLKSVETPDLMRVEFSYDAFARRVEKRVSKRTDAGWQCARSTRFIWDADVIAHEVVESFEADPVVAETTYVFEDGDFEPVAHRRAGKPWSYYIADSIGTPDRLVNDDGSVVTQLNRSAWGEGSDETPIGLLGQYHDEETCLSYSRFRYYSPDVGLFISPDPIGLYGGLQPYAYTNDPVDVVDPYGLSARLDNMGKTPGKSSKTGQEVIDRMIADGEAKTTPSGLQVKYVDPKDNKTKWAPASQCDMAHGGPKGTDAVTAWNKGVNGQPPLKTTGQKSKDVRDFMLDSDNYTLQPASINRSQGAKLGVTYDPPAKPPPP
jgi:RHS repeat-associated protein